MAETSKPDPEKIRQKVQFLRDSLRQLNLIRERGEAELIGDPILQAAAIRYLNARLTLPPAMPGKCPAATPGT